MTVESPQGKLSDRPVPPEQAERLTQAHVREVRSVSNPSPFSPDNKETGGHLVLANFYLAGPGDSTQFIQQGLPGINRLKLIALWVNPDWLERTNGLSHRQ